MTVTWSVGLFSKADAQKCYEEIGRDTEKIKPEEVLNIARNPETELHKCFEWDDAIAGEKYRLEQARKVIQFIVVKEDESDPNKPPKRPIRVFERSIESRTYAPIQIIARNEDEYQNLLNRAMDELRKFRERYAHIAELESVIEAIDNL